jgi:hypothetical protein
MNDSRIYLFGGIGRSKSNIYANGSATYSIEFVNIIPNIHNDNILNPGETARLFFKFPSRVEEDTILEFAMYPHNGRAEKKKIKVPEAVRAERVQLYP